jgi:hypothetical protein
VVDPQLERVSIYLSEEVIIAWAGNSSLLKVE